jgi:5-methylcytosine-specific restriction endonuclease McrA
MARLYQRWCRIPSCRNLTRDKSGYCQAHKKGHRKLKGDHKKSDPFYSSRQWLKLRDWYKIQQPICEICREHVTEIIHHRTEIKDGGDPFLVDNLQATCRRCHNQIHHGKESSATLNR